MKTKILMALMIIGIPHSAYANNPYNEFLLAAQTDITLSEINTSDMNILGSYVEDAQFRFNTSTPTSNVDLKKDALSYELRFKPKAWGQRDFEKSILKLRVNQQDISYQQLLNSALQKRYIKLLDYFEQYQRLQYLLEMSELLTQEASLIQSQVLSKQFNSEKLLNTKDTLKQTQDRIKLNMNRLKSMQTQLGLPLTTIASLQNHSGMDLAINVAEINKALASLNEADYAPLDIENARLKLLLSQSENQLLVAKQQLAVNLIKFEYSDRQNDQMAFQVGINIPLGTRFSNQESQHKLYAAQSQLSNNTSKIKQALSEMTEQITWLSQDWSLIKKQSERLQQHLQKDYAQSNPDLLIYLRKKLVDHKQKQTAINHKALALYVNYLGLSGLLVQPPLRNWIAHGTPQLMLN